MKTLEFTDIEMQAVLSAVRQVRNEADDTVKVLRTKRTEMYPQTRDHIEYYEGKSKILTAAMKKIYGAIDASD